MSSNDSQIMNYLVRMVVPMRREFGRKLDVAQFLHDFSYATEVLEEARSSQDARLREYANHVEKYLHGARIVSAPAAPVAAAAPAKGGSPARAAEAPPPADKTGPSDEDEMRARVMRKYTSGLR